MDPEKDTLFRGEFEVVKELIAAFDDGAASKAECDKVIDKNGPPPKGTGIKQLRENIAESKLSYEIMDDAGNKRFSKITLSKLDKIGTILDELFQINLSFSSNFPEGQDPRQHHKILHAHCLQRLYWVGGPFDYKDGGDDNLRPNQK